MGYELARWLATGLMAVMFLTPANSVRCLIPGGLFDILAPSFGEVDLHLQRSRWQMVA